MIRISKSILLLIMLGSIAVLSGCASRLPVPNPVQGVAKRLRPSNNRNWKTEFSRLSWVQAQGDQLKIHNIRNNQYVTETEFIPGYYNREIGLHQIQSVDYVVVPFPDKPSIAHTMLSFGLDDGSYISVSAEVRQEVGEDYSAVLGLANELELIYVIGDERDLVRLRTHHRDADVYLYPTVANPAQAQELFVSAMERTNKLAQKPEFYNTLANNCTTNIRRHIKELNPDRAKYSWQVLLPGHSDKYAYDLGLLDQRIPFEDLKEIAHVNDLVESHYDDADFSQKIRTGRERINRVASRVDTQGLELRGGNYLRHVR